jgi:hypothetical protein
MNSKFPHPEHFCKRYSPVIGSIQKRQKKWEINQKIIFQIQKSFQITQPRTPQEHTLAPVQFNTSLE